MPRSDEEIDEIGKNISKYEASAKNETNHYVDGKWRAYDSKEGGNPTVGYGHKVTDEELASGRFDSGLSDEDAWSMFRGDLRARIAKAQIPREWDKQRATIAADASFRGIPLKDAPLFRAALEAGDLSTAFRQTGDFNYKTPDGQKHYYDGRNIELFTQAGYDITPEDLTEYFYVQDPSLRPPRKKNARG
jgi:hypothetical protein